MSAKWSISNLPALAAICLLMLWCGPLSAQERDTVIIVKHDTVYLQHKPDTVVTGRGCAPQPLRPARAPLPQTVGSLDSNAHQDTVCRQYGTPLAGYGLGLRQAQPMGNGCFSGCPAQISVRLHQTDIYLEAELHPLEPANQGKPVLGRTPYLRYVLQHRVRR